MKKILFAITAAAIMIAAATMVPVVDCNESDVDEYIVNTVEVKDQFQSYLDSLNNKAEKQMVYDEEDCSYSLNTTAYEMYGEQEYDDVPIALTLDENGITSDYSPEVHGDITSTNSETTYDLVYDENGNIYDVIITVDGQDYSARDLYDPVEDCFINVLCAGAYVAYVPVYTSIAVSTGWIPFIGWLIAIIMVVIVVAVVCYYYYETHYAETDEGSVYFDYEEGVVDGIKVGKKNGNIVAVSILGQDYKVSDKYKNSNKDRDGFYFTLVIGNAYIFPKEIGESIAKKIMRLSDTLNGHGKYSVYTKYSDDAERIASILGTPTEPEIHGSVESGMMWHYHTCGHSTPAHAFFSIGRV